MRRRELITGLGALPLFGMASAPAPAADLEAVWRDALADPRQGRTDALLVMRDGEVLLEKYGADHGPGTRHVSWSMAKALTHALVGTAVFRREVELDAPVSVLPPGLGVSLRHLLTLTDGLPWDEARQPVAVASDASRLLFGSGRMDVARFAASRPGRPQAPGTRWNYSTGAYHLIAAELTARILPDTTEPEIRRQVMSDWMFHNLFSHLGTDFVVEFDPAGTFYGGSLMWGTARDFARLGTLYLEDGWRRNAFPGPAGIQSYEVLPPGWVRFARTPTVEPTYGAGWWLEGPHGPGAGPSLLGGSPADAFHARGLDGQVLLVVPSRRLIVVRLGYTPDGVTGWPAIGGCLRRIITVVS